MAAFLATMLTGCATAEFYWQAVRGQWSLIAGRRPVAAVMADPATPEGIKAKLAVAEATRRFAVDELALPVGGAYSGYVALHRSAVIYNVFAAPELSMTPVTWRYPFVGRLAYRGFFDGAKAAAFAGRLAADGYDVSVADVGAYSTLGWFDDPLTDVMLDRSDLALVWVIFHESAHRRLFFDDDTTFNESFATMVADEGVRRWLTRAGEEERFAAWRRFRERKEAVVRLIVAAKDDLARLYASAVADDEKRRLKKERIARLRSDYAAKTEGWNDRAGFGGWFAKPINNATLGAVGAYHDLAGPLAAKLARMEGDLPAFYAAVEAWRAMTPDERAARLAAEEKGDGDVDDHRRQRAGQRQDGGGHRE